MFSSMKHTRSKAHRKARTSGCDVFLFTGLSPKSLIDFFILPIMPKPDVWDSNQDSKRKNKRFLARWKVALVFDNATSKPIFQTLTNDLSMNGISMQSHSEEKIHTVLTLLLAPPPIDGVQQRIIKLKAVVMSSIPYRGGFRLGMSFIQDAELDKLQKKLGVYALSGESLPSYPEGDAFPKLLF